MDHPGFFERTGPHRLADIAARCGATVAPGRDGDATIADVRPLEAAGADDAAFIDNRKYLKDLDRTHAGACFVAPAVVERVPAATIPLVTPAPYHAFARALALFYPGASRPRIAEAGGATAAVHPTALVEDGAIIEPGAIVGREARIGRGTVVAAGAVVGYRVTVGRDGFVGPNVSLAHALLGDRVIIHAGASIGQDGFGFALGPKGHLKVPQIGRVIIQDDVEIGANTTIDRGALRDTVIGEGSKIDNLVQIAHNVVIGRHCVIAAAAGIAGSTELADFVIVGGQVGIAGHLKIGAGVQVAAQSGIIGDVEPGLRVGGSPARPLNQWARELATLKRLAERKP